MRDRERGYYNQKNNLVELHNHKCLASLLVSVSSVQIHLNDKMK